METNLFRVREIFITRRLGFSKDYRRSRSMANCGSTARSSNAPSAAPKASRRPSAVAAKNLKAAVVKERSRLTIPAGRPAADKLAPRYTNASLGEIAVVRAGAETRFDFGEWKSAMASRKNDDAGARRRGFDAQPGPRRRQRRPHLERE